MKTNKIPNKVFKGLWLIFGFLLLSMFIANKVWRTAMDEMRKEAIEIKNNKNPKKFTIRKRSIPFNQKNGSKTIIVKKNKNGKKYN